MALIHSELTLWELAFRWTNRDPDQIWIRIPLDVRDHFRNLMQAILAEELDCSTLRTEKRQPDGGSDPEFFIRHYIDAVYACVGGVRFDRKLLKWAILDRRAVQVWCRRRGIAPPGFWFPIGGKDFPQEELEKERELRYEFIELGAKRREALIAYLDLPLSDSGKEKSWLEVQKLDAAMDRLQAESQELDDQGIVAAKSEASPSKLRSNQEARIAVQTIARGLWKESPSARIAAIAKHDTILRLAGGRHFTNEVVYRWVSEVAPPEVSAKRGRPRKDNPVGD